MYALCRNNPGGNFEFCWRHGRQRPLPNVGAAAGPEPPQTAVVRERMREFERIRCESEAREYEARDRWAREEQRRREQERARAEREQEERQRQREQQWRQYQEQEQRRQQEERERREQQQRQEESHRQWQRSYQRQRRYRARNAEESARPSAEEQRRRDQQQEQARRAEAEREQREQARRATEDQLRARILQHYLDASAEFDQTIFSAQNPNHFARVPWPVFRRPDGTVRPGDVTRENVLRFFDVSRMRRFTGKTAREIDVILKNTARRFHPDRFSVNRAIVGSIRDLQDRNAVIQAAEIVIQTVNGLRGG
jgi:hypothetical protein